MTEKSYVGMMQCFYCMEASGVALDMRLRETLPQGPVIYDLEPCSSCAEQMKTHVKLIVVQSSSMPDVQRDFAQWQGRVRMARPGREREAIGPFIPNPYRTGPHGWLSREAVGKVFQNSPDNPGVVELILKQGYSFLDEEAWEALVAQAVAEDGDSGPEGAEDEGAE